MPRGAGSSRGGKKRRSDEAFRAAASAQQNHDNDNDPQQEPAASRGNKKKAKTSTSTSGDGDGSAAAGVARRPAAPEAPNENHHHHHDPNDNHNHNNNSNDRNDYDPFMVALLQHYVDHLSSGGTNPPPPLQRDKALAILQVCAGNRTMAAQLYWDDYFATTAHQNQQQNANQNNQNQNANQNQQQNANQARVNQNPSPPPAGQAHLGGAAAADNNHNDSNLNFDLMDMNLYHDDTAAFDLSSSRRGIRRSLDAAFGRVANGNNDAKPSARHSPHAGTNSNSSSKKKKKKKSSKKSPPSSSNHKKNVTVIDPRIRQAAARVAAQVWAHKEKDQENDNDESSTSIKKKRSHNSKDQLLKELEQEYSDIHNDDIMEDDNEWWQQPAHPTTATALLWGHPQQKDSISHNDVEDPKTSTSTAVVEDATTSTSRNEDNKEEHANEKDNKDNKAKQEEPSHHKQDSHSSNSSEDDDDDEIQMEEDDDESSSSSSSSHSSTTSQQNQNQDQNQTNQEPPAGIPHTWMHASFSLSECTTGLVAKAPKLEDVELFVWRQQQHSSRQVRLSVPPPYHCRSVTAVLSAVTCLLYTGASHCASHNQANVVTSCTSTQTPWLQLSPDERKRQFEARLADAITALLATAAHTARRRHAYAYQKAQMLQNVSQEDLQKMKQRLNLVPTCRWETPPSAALVNEANGPLYQNVTLVTSWTHIADLKAYVVSSMEAFTGPGGVALLLETVARMHGTSVLQKCSTTTGSSMSSLIHCTCCERSKRHYETNPLTPSERNDTHNYMDTSVAPTETESSNENGDCIVADSLLRLLLTGQTNCKDKGEWSWSTGGMEFGLLCNSKNAVGWQLARPNQPVWMVQGKSSGYYSVLALDYNDDTHNCKTKEQRTAVARLDQPGSVLPFLHWNGWYDGLQVGMRLRTAQKAWKAPNHKLNLDQPQQQQQKHNMVDWMNEKRRQEEHIRAVSAREHTAVSQTTGVDPIQPEEIEHCQAHPDDVKFYPDNFCMWRFDVPEVNATKENNDPENDKKPRGKHWTPYRRLTERQQMIVECKLGPKVKPILWTRWPKATIDHFEPKDKVPLV